MDRTRSIANRLALPAVLLLATMPPLGCVDASDDAAGHSGHAGHDMHAARDASATATDDAPTPLSEPGQGAFAALAEAVAALSADPATDWSRVDVDALREHLVSMERLVLGAEVERVAIEGGYRFVVGGTGRTRRAIDEMVPAHAAVLAAATPWTVTATRTADGATLSVTSDEASERERIEALGFFGLMATGDHHREHHWGMVRGETVHDH